MSASASCDSPESRFRPIDAPIRLPVWNAAFPNRIVTVMSPSAPTRIHRLSRLSRMASASPRRPARPTRAAMSWRMTVAVTENKTAHRSVTP